MPHSSKHGAQPPAGANAAKETFLNYFFGQNGPGPLAGASADRAAVAAAAGATGVTLIGRDVSGSDPMLQAGLMAGKRSLEGNNAAFDMKSLGRHIEAVSLCFRPPALRSSGRLLFACISLTMMSCSPHPHPDRAPRGVLVSLPSVSFLNIPPANRRQRMDRS